jgi:alpha-galactosidase
VAFNSTKHLLVHLDRPGRRLVGDIGLENNDDTQRGEALGQGSVTFHVFAGDKEVFASPVRKRKDGPMRLEVPLGAAREFELQVRDGGDGRGWDQALWAEAVIELEDGSRLRLQDLPSADAVRYNPWALSFRYGGSNSVAVIHQWPREVQPARTENRRDQRTVTFRQPKGLELRVEVEVFEDFPALEWVGYFSNRGEQDSPLLEQIQAIDLVLPVVGTAPAQLHWAKGAVASFDDFAPQETLLKPGTKLRLQPGGGRSSSQVLPFFNVEGAGGGLVAAVGWSGEWAAEFNVDARGQVMLKAGLDRTHLVLHPGETIRTPRMLLLFYEGEQVRGQNLLRQFLLAHHRPVGRDRQPLVAPITCGNWGGTRAEVHLDNIKKIEQHGLPIAYYWIDAEWFGRGGWPVSVGDWEVKKDLYPQSFQPLSTALRQTGRELMLWFEPERVYRGTPWHKEHREWLLDTGGDSLLWNLGDSNACRFLTDFIDSKVKEFGLGCYRQDFNIDPLPFWRAADAPDRQGMAEIRYIEGLYAFWDGLLRRNPGLLIDNCASGGRRIDLETVGRATPFWRTDGPRDAIAHQCHTYGLMSWVPLSATSQDRAGDDYEFRSSMCSSLCLNWWVSGDVSAERIPDTFPFPWAKRTLDQYLGYRGMYYGDHYPLTGYSQAGDLWMAYQLDRPETGKGLIVALRRPQSPYESARLRLRGLSADATYKVVDLDTQAQTTLRGAQLAAEGLEVRIGARPGSALLVYERQ